MTKEYPAVKPVKTDKNNLNISRDEFIEKRAKEKELAARLALESKKIEHELEEEYKEKKTGKKKKKTEENEEV